MPPAPLSTRAAYSDLRRSGATADSRDCRSRARRSTPPPSASPSSLPRRNVPGSPPTSMPSDWATSPWTSCHDDGRTTRRRHERGVGASDEPIATAVGRRALRAVAPGDPPGPCQTAIRMNPATCGRHLPAMSINGRRGFDHPIRILRAAGLDLEYLARLEGSISPRVTQCRK